MVTLCCNSESLVDVFSKWSQIILGVLTLCLAFYVFIYQKNKDKKDVVKADLIAKKAIKLQWFKDIIIEPNVQYLFKFYENVSGIKQKIKSTDLSDDEKVEIIQFIKEEQSQLRKSFLDLVRCIDSKLFDSIFDNIDLLTDALTNTISNDELKLKNDRTYEREINSKIQSSYAIVMEMIFSYEG